MTTPTNGAAPAGEPKERVETEWTETFNDGTSDAVQVLSYADHHDVYGTRWKRGQGDVSDTYLAGRILAQERQIADLQRALVALDRWHDWTMFGFDERGEDQRPACPTNEEMAGLDVALAAARAALAGKEELNARDI